MRKGIVKYNNIKAGILSEEENGEYQFVYDEEYVKKFPQNFITFQMPVSSLAYHSKRLFPFFDGLIPEGWLLNIASKSWKINKNDRMGLLLACCQNAIGAVTIHPINSKTDEEE
jgi:serine/threonine-protein kinase HipA